MTPTAPGPDEEGSGPDVGVIGGSGLYALLEHAQTVRVEPRGASTARV